jgi:hypothetical protein
VAEPTAFPDLDPDAPRSPRPTRDPVVDWIADGTTVGRTVHSAIPGGYDRYATIVIPDLGPARGASDAALVEVLRTHTSPQPWHLGFLDTGVADVVDEQAPRSLCYQGWGYVMLQGGPDDARSLRCDEDGTPWHSALPELLFPADRSWLVSTLWDDDWRCVGGPTALVEALLARPELEIREVTTEQDATPPGHDCF